MDNRNLFAALRDAFRGLDRSGADLIELTNVTVRLPPIIWQNFLLMARPRPVPPYLF